MPARARHHSAHSLAMHTTGRLPTAIAAPALRPGRGRYPPIDTFLETHVHGTPATSPPHRWSSLYYLRMRMIGNIDASVMRTADTACHDAMPGITSVHRRRPHGSSRKPQTPAWACSHSATRLPHRHNYCATCPSNPKYVNKIGEGKMYNGKYEKR